MPEILNEIMKLTISGSVAELNPLVKRALSDGLEAGEILNGGLIAGMNEVGRCMSTGEMFIPEVLRAARTMQSALEILKPYLSEEAVAGAGTVVIGTVEGDVHDIGKNLVAMMLEGSGFKVVDLGIDVKADTFIAAIREHQPKIVAMSALLTTTVANMKKTIAAIKESGLRDQVKIMAGGAPISQRMVIEELGADGFGASAAEAVDTARALVS